MGSGPICYQIGNKTCFIPKVSKFYVEKRYFVNSLESVIFGMQTWDMEIDLKGLEMQKRIISTDRVQIVGEKNRVICLVIMFTPRFKVIKMSKVAHYLYFLLMTPENQSQFEQNI